MSTLTRPPHQRARSQNAIEAQQSLLGKFDRTVDYANLLEDDLDALGLGRYQIRLLVLCGFGWLSDNATLQCIAVILPRVQTHFSLSATGTSLLSAATMSGMAVGAYTWGSIADSAGRTLPYHCTILLTGLFNLGASYAGSFRTLCFWMFAVGTSVGGSMPTDGTLFLENLPLSKQYLLTSLSTFFAFGAVLSSVIGMLVLPEASCETAEVCDVEGGANDGWRRMLFVIALLDLLMFAIRSIAFRLQESPRFLVAKGHVDECARILNKIAHINGITDFTPSVACEGSLRKIPQAMISDHEVVLDPTNPGAVTNKISTPPPHSRMTSSARLEPLNFNLYGHQHSSAVSASMSSKKGRGSFFTPSEELESLDWDGGDKPMTTRRSSDGLADEGLGTDTDSQDGTSSRHEVPFTRKELIQNGLDEWASRFGSLFRIEWWRTTILMIYIWMSMALAYGMYNVWLPTVLEQRSREAGKTLYDALLEYVWFSLAGVPGSMIGGWLIETRLGRRKSLALSTISTAVMTFLFSQTNSRWAEILTTCLLANAASIMYAILYGMTPETFTTSLRGTAVGFLAAASRIAGIAAPIAAGQLLSVKQSLPLICSAIVFISTAVCSVLLPFEKAPGARGSGSAVVAH